MFSISTSVSLHRVRLTSRSDERKTEQILHFAYNFDSEAEDVFRHIPEHVYPFSWPNELGSFAVGFSRGRGAAPDSEQPQRRAPQAGRHPLDLSAHAVFGGGEEQNAVLYRHPRLGKVPQQYSHMPCGTSSGLAGFHTSGVCASLVRTRWGAAVRAAAWSWRSYPRWRRRERSSTSRSPTALSQVGDQESCSEI